MIDSLAALAFSVYENKGVYRLLLGSGVSQPPEIPSGWEITLDLVRRIAALRGVTDEPDWAAWYKATFGTEIFRIAGSAGKHGRRTALGPDARREIACTREVRKLLILFLDDAAQKNCSRERVGRLVAIGGVAIEAAVCRKLELAIDELCIKTYGFPAGEPFKWSPNKDHWMRTNLTEDRRRQFYNDVLTLAAKNGAIGLAAVSDATKGLAIPEAKTAEMDVFIMTLERFDIALGQDVGMVVAARPSGGKGDEHRFLVSCAEAISAGTNYVKFEKFVTAVVTMPSSNSRLLQLADLVVSICTAMIAGHKEFAGKVFPAVRTILRASGGRVGGIGLKIHPDFSYANLYHWLLGDTQFKNSTLPIARLPFPNNEDKY